MNIAIEEVSACRRRLRVEVPADRVAAETSRITADFQQHAQLKGFRAGKAPRAVVARHYAKEIAEEVKRLLISSAFQEAVASKQLKVSTALNLEEVDYVPGASLGFSALVDVEPDFTLPAYKGLKVKKGDPTVSDAEVADTLDRLRQQMADYVTVSGRALQAGDLAVVTYEGRLAGQPLLDLLPNAKHLAKNEKFWMLVRDDTFLPGFTQQLLGANPGDTRAVNVTFPADFPQENLRGKVADYEVKLEEIKETVLPAFNDAFAQQIAKVTAEELRRRVTENLQTQKTQQLRNEQVRQLLEQLGGAANFDLPESSVQSQTRSLIYDIVRENEMRGVARDVLEEKKQDIFANAQNTAKGQVRLGFILGKIAAAEQLTVSDDEFAAEVSRLAAQERVAPRKFIQQLQAHDGFADLRDNLLNRKTVEFLLQSAIME
ncbi:MAG: trigger factor [Verrucomicrobiales bacterium]|jgi:trigger factor|nr:trigger factor [Verrucomicrobiales bacterium]